MVNREDVYTKNGKPAQERTVSKAQNDPGEPADDSGLVKTAGQSEELVRQEQQKSSGETMAACGASDDASLVRKVHGENDEAEVMETIVIHVPPGFLSS